MQTFRPRDPGWQARVRASFARQTVMTTIGAHLGAMAPGAVDIALPFRADLCQQHGFLHAGIVTTIADSSCGYAALSLMAPDAAVLTVEFKVNLLAPARGDRLLARGPSDSARSSWSRSRRARCAARACRSRRRAARTGRERPCRRGTRSRPRGRRPRLHAAAARTSRRAW